MSNVRQLFLASTKNMDARIHLKSTENIEREQRRHLSGPYWYIIHPFSLFRYSWDKVMCFVIYLLPVVETFLLTFEQKKIYSENVDVCVIIFSILVTILSVMAIIDMILNFMTGFYDRKKRAVRLSHEEIVVNFFTGWRFLRHFIFLIPVYLIAITFEKYSNITQFGPNVERFSSYRDWLSLLTFSKVVRLNDVSEFIQKYEKYSTSNKTLWKFVNLLLYSTVLYHFSACAVMNVFSLTEKYIYEQIEGDCVPEANTPWIICENILFTYAHSVFGRYLRCLMRVSRMLAMFGEGVGHNHSFVDRIFTVVVRFLGVWNILYIINYLTVVVRANFTGERKFQVIRGYIDEMTRYKKLPLETKKKVITFFEHSYDRKFVNEMRIMYLLSPQLRIEVMNHCMKDLIKDLPYFADLPDNIILKLIHILGTEVYLPGDMVASEGSVEKALYILATGVAYVAFDEENDEGSWNMEPGSYFGIRSFVEDEHMLERNIVAMEICEFKVMRSEDFLRVMKPHGNYLSKIQDTIIEDYIINGGLQH